MSSVYDIRWLHVKTGGFYRIVGFCVREKDLVNCVLYRKETESLVWCRPCIEFFDGRFIIEV